MKVCWRSLRRPGSTLTPGGDGVVVVVVVVKFRLRSKFKVQDSFIDVLLYVNMYRAMTFCFVLFVSFVC